MERKGKFIHVDGPKTEKAREPAVESLVQQIWRLSVLEKKRGEYRRACKVEDSPVSGGTVNQRASIGEKNCG